MPQDSSEDFIQAVKENEYAEYEIAPGLVLITDSEGDEVFTPYVVDMGDRGSQQVDDMMADVSFVRCEGTEYDKENSPENAAVYDIVGAELAE